MHDQEEDVDALFETLEDEIDNPTDPTLQSIRAARMQTLAREIHRAKTAQSDGYGTYTSISSEKTLLELTTTHARCIVHFHKPDFNRCRIMDGHLEVLAQKNLDVRVVKMDVQHAPFLVERLGVKVLPCVIGFVDGVGVDRVVGFEGLGAVDDKFETNILEQRFMVKGILIAKDNDHDEDGMIDKGRIWGKNGRSNHQRETCNDDDDDDWD